MDHCIAFPAINGSVGAVMGLQLPLQPLGRLLGMTTPIGAAARHTKLCRAGWWDDAGMVTVQVEPAAILGGEGHVAVDTGYARLIAADDVAGIALWLVVEGSLFVAVVASEARLVEPAERARGAGDRG